MTTETNAVYEASKLENPKVQTQLTLRVDNIEMNEYWNWRIYPFYSSTFRINSSYIFREFVSSVVI